MAAEENRLAHFRRLVESRSPLDREGRPILREGYRAVADATGLTYDYVYQVYTGKSGKKGLGAKAAKKISEVFGVGKPAGWMDQPLDAENLDAEFEPLVPPTLEAAWSKLGEVLTSLDDIGREMAVTILTSLAKNPEKAAQSFQMLDTLVRVHGKAPEDPKPPTPTKPKKITTSAPAVRSSGKAALVLKIGGGKKQQFDLPLVRSAFRSDSAPPNERAWYERVRAVPKARA
jgi:hypothetical protein